MRALWQRELWVDRALIQTMMTQVTLMTPVRVDWILTQMMMVPMIPARGH